MDILAIAQAGMTVLDPSPVKPESIPLTSRVGRAPVRSLAVKPALSIQCRRVRSLRENVCHLSGVAPTRRVLLCVNFCTLS